MNNSTERQPTIEELRRVAKYMAEVMGLHSAAGKLIAQADRLEHIVGKLMEVEEHSAGSDDGR